MLAFGRHLLALTLVLLALLLEGYRAPLLLLAALVLLLGRPKSCPRP